MFNLVKNSKTEKYIPFSRICVKKNSGIKMIKNSKLEKVFEFLSFMVYNILEFLFIFCTQIDRT